jgi:PAS domain S-box-containing protein
MKLKNLKILAIDDLKDNLIILKELVEKTLPGVEVLTALSGKKGLELARSEDPDVILLDIVMPEMDGFEVCRKLKSDKVLRSIPVVFLTAILTDQKSRIKALKAGAEGFISKPWDEAELIAQVNAMAKIKLVNHRQKLEKKNLENQVAERTSEIEQQLTELRKVEERLRYERDRAQKYLNIAGVILIVLEVEGKVQMINQRGCEILGYTHNKIIGKDWFENFLPVKILEHLNNLFISLLSGKDNLYEYFDNPILTQKSEERIISWHNTILWDDRGNIIGTLSSGEDITERIQLEHDLEEQNKHLEDLVKERTAELEQKNIELERFNKLFIGRESRIKELRDKVKKLEKQLYRN